MTLHVTEWGTGDRIAVLVHGITSDATGWSGIGPALADRGYRVLAPDLPGHGYSPRAERYTLNAAADELAAAVPAEPALAIGHSLGGLLLSMVEGRIRPARTVYEDPAWIPAASPEMMAAFRAQKQWTIDDLRAADPGWPEARYEDELARLARWDETMTDSLTGMGFEPDEPKRPALLLAVERDALIDPDHAESLRTKGFTVRTLAGVGHSAHRDDPAGFLAAIDAWLAATP
ncbi:MAG TPA: alpha/beta fold hydrolase [Actinocatenispora sp.]